MRRPRRARFAYSWEVGGRRLSYARFVTSRDLVDDDGWAYVEGDPAASFASSRWREPFVSTPEDVVRRMLEVAGVRSGERVYDLGCGDGRIPITAAREFGAYGVGVEIRKQLVDEARAKIAENGLEDRVEILRGTFRKTDMGDADVVAVYLTSGTLQVLERKFRNELRPGARIVTFDYPIYGWTPDEEVPVRSRERSWKGTIYRYVR